MTFDQANPARPSLATGPLAATARPPRGPRASSAGPWIVIGLLTMNVGIVAGTIAFATAGSTLKVQPGWDQADRTWDQRQAALRAQRELGWQAHASGQTPGLVTLSLRDRAGAPVDRARVHAKAFHAAHPADVRPLLFDESAPGAYVAALSEARAGSWTVQLEVQRGAQTLREEREIQVVSVEAARPSQEDPAP